MSRISTCRRCGGNIVEPAFEGDGAYDVGRMCRCPENQPNPATSPSWTSERPSSSWSGE